MRRWRPCPNQGCDDPLSRAHSDSVALFFEPRPAVEPVPELPAEMAGIRCNVMADIHEVVRTFKDWATAQGLGPARAEVRVERLGRPHTPAALPSGWQGVYGFRYEGTWLKVGKAGPKSGMRWISQHYNPGSAMSTLAFSLVKYGHYATMNHPSLPGLRMTLRGVSPDDIGEWIRRNTERVNLLLRAEMGASGLSQLESIAHARLKPVFEGRWQFGEPAI